MEEYIEGIDVSHWQGDINHMEVAQSGMKFCICKATEGVNSPDPKFAENIAQIREVLDSGETYYPGAFHFARPDSVGGAEDGRAEAEDFCDVIEEHCGDISENFMPPALDFEKYSESDVTDNSPFIEAFVTTVERRTGRRPMIYTGKNVWYYEVGNTDEFIDYPLWQVYYSGTAESPPEMPWPTWTMWQYSGGGNYQHHPDVPGVGVVDVNRWHGTLEELKQFAHANESPPPPVRTWPTPPKVVDLNVFRGSYSDYVARVQGLLLSYGYGPDGLVSNGHPDGMMGDKTESYLVDFKGLRGLPRNAVMDWDTWWALTYDKVNG